jgi:hypothetical protein
MKSKLLMTFKGCKTPQINWIYAFCFFSWIYSCSSWSHPSYVRLGYISCTGCHLSSQGGGLLTFYGKGVANSQSMYPSKSLSERLEKEALEQGEKLEKKQWSALQALQFRYMRHKTKNDVRSFPMQLDYHLAFQKNQDLWFEGALAVAPPPRDEPQASTNKTYERVFFRKLGMTKTFDHSLWTETRLFLGIHQLPFGLGLVDHTHYNRSENRLNVTDIPIQAQLYLGQEKWTGHTFLYLPHPREAQGNQEHGLGTQWWRHHPWLSVGIQSLWGRSDDIERYVNGVLWKTGSKKWAWMNELNWTHRELNPSASQPQPFDQRTWFSQFSFYAHEHLLFFYHRQGLERTKEYDSQEQRESFGFERRVWAYFTVSAEYRKRMTANFTEYSHYVQLYFNGW